MARGGLLRGKTIGIDSTTLEANAARKSIVRRDTQESYTEYLKRLAEAEGVKVEDAAAVRRMDPLRASASVARRRRGFLQRRDRRRQPGTYRSGELLGQKFLWPAFGARPIGASFSNAILGN